MTKVLILGGGFAGVAAVLALKKNTKADVEVVLVDRNYFHLFTPSLYEVATSEEPQKNIAIPFQEIFDSRVKVVQAKIDKVDFPNQKVLLENGESLDYNYLIISLGSETSYFNIPGLKENALDLKTLAEAVKIKDKVKEVNQNLLQTGRKARVVIGGGGFSGTELAAELINYREKLTKDKNQVFEIAIIEGSERLLNGLDPKVSLLAKKRLEKHQVQIFLNCLIKEVRSGEVETKEGQKINFDLLIWTGGITGNSLLGKSGLDLNKKGQIEVDNNLKVKGFENVFAAGDVASFTEPNDQKPAPSVAQVAEEEGRVAGENVARAISGEKLGIYKLRHFGYLVPMKGKFVVAELGLVHLRGFLAWIVQQFVFLRYLLGIMSLPKAFKRWNKFELELEQ